MATIREIRARFVGEVDGLRTAFRSIQTEASRLGPAVQSSVNTANRSYGTLQTTAQKLQRELQAAGQGNHFDGLNRAAQTAQREIEATGRVSAATMEELQREATQAGSEIAGMGTDARRSFEQIEGAVNAVLGEVGQLNSSNLGGLQSEANQASGAIDNIGDAANQASNHLDDMDGGALDDLSGAADDAGGSLGGLVSGAGGGILAAVSGGLVLATGAVGAFVAAGAGLYGFIKSSDELQKSVNGLQAETGATKEEIDGMRDSLVNIYGNNFGDGFQDIADAMADVKRNTGLAGVELETMTQNALMLRDTFDYEVNESVRSASTLMKNFGISGDEAYALIAEGSQKGLNYADDLLDTINEYSVYYEQAGFSAQEMFGMFDNAQKTGAFNLDYAADAFKEFGIIMTEDSNRAAVALERMGLPAEKLIGDFAKGGESAREAFNVIAEKLGTVKDPLEANQIGVELFGTKFEDLGTDAVIAMSQTNDSIKGTKDALDGINAIKYNTIGEAITGVGRMAVANILIPIQDKVMPGVNKSIGAMTSTVGTLFGALKDLIRGDESASSIIQSYGLDPKQFDPVIRGIDTVQNTLKALRDAAVPAMKTAGGAIKDALIAVWPMVRTALSTAASFIGTFIGLIVGFWRDNGKQIFNTIKGILIDIWPTVKSALSAAGQFIGDTVRKILRFWQTDGKQIADAAGNIFKGIKAVVEFVMPVVLAVVKMIFTAVKGVITGALDVIMGAFKIFSGLFTGDWRKMWEGVKQLVMGAIKLVWNAIQLTFFGKILSGAKVFILSFRTFFTSLWSAIVTLFKGNAQAAMVILRTAWATILRNTKDVFTAVSNFFKGTWSAISNIFKSTVSTIRSLISTGFTGVWNFIKSIFTTIRTFLSSTTSNIWNNIKTVFNGILATTRTIFRSVKNFIVEMFTAARNFLNTSTGNILTRIRDTWNSVKTSTTNTFRDIFNAIKGRFTDIVNAAKALPGRIGDGIGAMASKVTGGITKVINAMARTLGKGVNGVIGGVNWVLDKMNSSFEIKRWTVPQWAHGTEGRTGGKGHPGGPMVVGDGTGSNAGPELIETPDGSRYLSPSKPTLMMAPQGTKIWSATLTRQMMDDAPHYALGNMVDAALDWGKQKLTSGVAKVAKKVFDITSFLKNPSGLLNAALSALGISAPTGSGMIPSLVKGGYGKVKEGAVGYIKKKIAELGDMLTGGTGQGFGSAFGKSSGYGWRIHPISGKRTFHNGNDLAAPYGTPIPSQAAGQVVFSGYLPSRGNTVRIKSGPYERTYQHNTRNMVGVGDIVRKGQIVGTVGSTGDSTGPHLHYEVKHNGRIINPTGHADGGIVRSPELSWLAEGGFAESVISHDPSKKSSQQEIWQRTGEMLGFSTASAADQGAILGLLKRIAVAVEAGHNIIMDEQLVAEVLKDPITRLQQLDTEISEYYNR